MKTVADDLDFDSEAFQELIVGLINSLIDQTSNMIISLFWTQIFLGTIVPFVTGSEDFMGIDNVTLVLFIGICGAFWIFMRKFP